MNIQRYSTHLEVKYMKLLYQMQKYFIDIQNIKYLHTIR